RQVAGAPVFPVLAEVNLLLRLRGLYVGRDGVPTDLPRADGPQCMPLVPAASTCAIPSCDGGVAYGAGCDRRCVTSALLLAQQHVHDTDLSQVGLIQAMDRAFACLEKNLHGMRLH